MYIRIMPCLSQESIIKLKMAVTRAQAKAAAEVAANASGCADKSHDKAAGNEIGESTKPRAARTFPNEIWHEVSKYLKPKELYSFIRTSFRTKNAPSRSQIAELRLWDAVFKNYDWVECVTSRGLVAVLVYRDEKKSYIDLRLAVKEIPWSVNARGESYKNISFGANNVFATYEEELQDKVLVFNKIVQSLRWPLETPNEVKYSKFTLDLRGILVCPSDLPTTDLTWAFQNSNRMPREVDMAIYGHGIRKIKPSHHSWEALEYSVAGLEPIRYRGPSPGQR